MLPPRGAFPADQFRCKALVFARSRGISDDLDQVFQTIPSHAIEVMVDGRQRRIEESGLGDIVKTDQRYLLGHLDARLVQCSQRPECHLIIADNDCRKAVAADLEKLSSRTVSSLSAPVAFDHWAWRQTKCLQRPLPCAPSQSPAPPGVETADARNLGMAELGEMPCCEATSGLVVECRRSNTIFAVSVHNHSRNSPERRLDVDRIQLNRHVHDDSLNAVCYQVPCFVHINFPRFPMKALFFRLRTSATVVILYLWLIILFTVSSRAATTIRWLTLSDAAWPASVKKVIAAFEAQNPDIKVELDTYPFRDLFETIEVRMKAQDADVDLISVDVPLVASYSVRGYLAPIDEYFSKDEIEKTWVKPSWQAGTYKGSFMAAPQNSSTQFFYINRKLFQQYNVTPPKSLEPGKETTYDEIASIANRFQ